jgi:hypothetical protein
MDAPMIGFAARRVRNLGVTAAAALTLIVLYVRIPGFEWQTASQFTGWLLVAAVLFLVLFNIRKKLPFLPLLSATAWLQLHVHVAILAILMFALHTGMRIPSSPLERALFILFVALAATGVTGFWLSRQIPSRLHSRCVPVLFDRIGAFRAQLAHEVEALAARSVAETSSMVIAELYARRIEGFLRAPRNVFAHLLESRRPLMALRNELRDVERYLSKRGREILGEIDERLVAKDNLDYQYALEITLKAWLFIHIPMAYAVIPLIAFHVILFYGFARL